MEQDNGIAPEAQKAIEDEIKINGRWNDEQEALERLDNAYKFLVSASPGDLVQQFNNLYLLSQQIFQENLQLRKKVNKITGMYLQSELRLRGMDSAMIYNFRRQHQA